MDEPAQVTAMKSNSLPVHMVYVTAPDLRTARRLARLAIDQRLAACANLFPCLHSVYRWKGQIEQSNESGLLLKTSTVRLPALLQALQKAHPYECPCIVHWQLAGGCSGFIQWIHDETRVEPRTSRSRTPKG